MESQKCACGERSTPDGCCDDQLELVKLENDHSAGLVIHSPIPEFNLICEIFLRSEEHTSELQSQSNLVCRLLLEKKNKIITLVENSPSHSSSHVPTLRPSSYSITLYSAVAALATTLQLAIILHPRP